MGFVLWSQCLASDSYSYSLVTISNFPNTYVSISIKQILFLIQTTTIANHYKSLIRVSSFSFFLCRWIGESRPAYSTSTLLQPMNDSSIPSSVMHSNKDSLIKTQQLITTTCMRRSHDQLVKYYICARSRCMDEESWSLAPNPFLSSVKLKL